ncbi:chemotaxis response regulator protein-glutamate methylesterase [Terasakiella sp. A23]|uniref:protein-glutamate methylesterase/protein-glutamine glutaminase n=1 Tax=Terasakiella sp. FCG-A23 TaxID=3080561 RepID=UPI0029556297|nr:chemotaxis response regulator protein-glutamate methylesterase [Terasakiella sp. A23]MDV7338993.1 chemotaxis response regulator protein-glutamate methylesterase [Terasakiella sp. A23]
MSFKAAPKNENPIRVMVVDDSAVVRGLITRMLEAEADIKVVSSVGNGKMAVDSLARNEVEVVVLDIEMPVMDGLTALPKMLETDKSIRVIMASTLTSRNADISLKALQAGAVDYIPKPSSSRELSGGQNFGKELVEKVRIHGDARRKVKGAPVGGVSKPRGVAPRPSALTTSNKAKEVVLRKPVVKERPEIIAIGSSTGGPQALFAVLKGMYGKVKQPIVITQHMPATFTKILAEHINRMTGWTCQEATDGTVIEPGQIYLAPGDFHMVVENAGAQKKLRLNQDPPENFCRPAVDPMLRSVVAAYGKKVLTVILTGMGSDGLKGGKIVVETGGDLIAQDEATSVVWGMPGAVAQAGICSAVLPLDEISSYVVKAAGGAS